MHIPAQSGAVVSATIACLVLLAQVSREYLDNRSMESH